MATWASIHIQMASVMDVLTKIALAEMTKLFDVASAALRLEISRSQRENEALKSKLLVMEGELRAARGCGEGTPDSSLNIALEVKVCDEFRAAQNSWVAGEGNIVAVEGDFDERLSSVPIKDELHAPVEKKEAFPESFQMKYEPVDREQDWCEPVLLGEDWLEEDPKASTSRLEQKISEEDACGTSGAASSEGGKGPVCEEEVELHMQPCPAGDPEKVLQAKLEQEGEPLTPGQPLLGSAGGLEAQCAWSTRSGKVREMLSNDRFSPRYVRASRRLRSEKNEGPTSHLEQQQNGRPLGPPDGLSAEMASPLGLQGERTGSAPCEASFDESAEAISCREIKGKRFICLECGKAFAHLGVLENHQQIHSRKKPFACSGCDKTFTQQHVLKAHESMHTRQRPHVCTDCGKRFLFKSNLKIHQRVHTGERPFLCTQCGKSFSQNSGLRTHQVTHTREKCFCCTVCNKSFAYLHILKRHLRVHTRKKCLVCKVCGKLFDDADSLKQHHVTHHGGKCFSCTLCGKGFTAKGSLKSHQSVHTGEKPHSCDDCGKSFALLCNLRTHRRVHTGERPYSCTQCGQSFSQNHVLQTHIRTHSK